ncbi:hypothetical protein GCM10020000_05690 [Streptomyces olivoverticillatus]
MSNLTGELATDEQLCSPGYWVEHVRRAVRFADGIRTLRARGVTTFLELGPDGVLSAMAEDTLGEEHGAVLVPVLRDGRPEELSAVAALARLQVHGTRVDWQAWFAVGGARRVDLPTYAFQRESYWPKVTAAVSGDAAADPAHQRLWAAVERGDTDELATILGLAEDQLSSLGSVLPALSSWRQGRQEKSLLDSWRYRVEWTRLRKPAVPALDGTWLLVTTDATDAALADALADALSTHGAQTRRLVLDPSCTDRETLAARLDGIEDATGVLSLLPLDERPDAGHPALTTGLALTAALVQTLGTAEAGPRLWTATQGAVSTGPADPVTRPLQAAAWGLGRVAALEHPRLWGGLIDLPEALDRHSAQRLAGVLSGLDGEDQVTVRASGVSGRRLARWSVEELPAEREFTARGTVLVTGGTGALGAEVARWLARSGAQQLVLTSRRGPDAPGADALRAELEELGARVRIAACDVADRDALAALLNDLPDDLPLTGVVHTAGVGQAAPLAETGLAEFADLMAAKAAGAAHLDALLGERELDFFVLFGSIAGVWGSSGQSAYGAGNAYLDALAEHRRARGLAATSVAWGPWAEAGMAVHEAVSGQLARQGLSFLAPGSAMTELRRAVVQRDVTVTVADVDWARYFPLFASMRPSALLSSLPEVRAIEQHTRDESGAASEYVLRVRGLDEPEQERLLVELVRSEAAAVLGHDSVEGVPEQRAFREIGFDSLTAVELRKRLTTVTGMALPSTMVFDYPTPLALAHYLRSEILGADLEVAQPRRHHGGGRRRADRHHRHELPLPRRRRLPRRAVAAGRLRHGRRLRVPRQPRLGHGRSLRPRPRPARQDLLHPGRIPARGGRVRPRLLRHLAARGPRHGPAAAAAAGELLGGHRERRHRPPVSLRSSLTGTFIGSSYQEYGRTAEPGNEGHMVTGSSPSVLSGRVSYVFGLEGPAVTVDTACSSSLVALHLACQSLRNGETTLALAGGVTVMTTPPTRSWPSAASAPSPPTAGPRPSPTRRTA